MKKSLIIVCSLFFCFSSKDMKAQTLEGSIVNDNLMADFFLVGCILILVGLAWWLVRNSYLLDETSEVKSMKESKDWIDQNLYDLDAEQIDMLIKQKRQQISETKNNEETN